MISVEYLTDSLFAFSQSENKNEESFRINLKKNSKESAGHDGTNNENLNVAQQYSNLYGSHF